MKVDKFFYMQRTYYHIKFRSFIITAFFIIRVVLGEGSLLKITLYILRNNCIKFDAFVCSVPISLIFTTKQLDYYNWIYVHLPTKGDTNGLWCHIEIMLTTIHSSIQLECTSSEGRQLMHGNTGICTHINTL